VKQGIKVALLITKYLHCTQRSCREINYLIDFLPSLLTRKNSSYFLFYCNIKVDVLFVYLFLQYYFIVQSNIDTLIILCNKIDLTYPVENIPSLRILPAKGEYMRMMKGYVNSPSAVQRHLKCIFSFADQNDSHHHQNVK